MTTPDEFAPDDAQPVKKSHKKKPSPPTVNDSLTVEAPSIPHPSPIDTPPIGDPSMGMKDPTVIRWHLSTHPERMEEIYGPYDWRAQLGRHADIPALED